jgi:hypothetical protein
MIDPNELEETFARFTKNLNHWIPDGFVQIDLQLLQSLDLLHSDLGDTEGDEESLTYYFHVIESDDKLTLFNDEFVVWIIPDGDHATTYALIARSTEGILQLEMGFAAAGVYNSSELVLKVLEQFLLEIKENDALIEEMSN